MVWRRCCRGLAQSTRSAVRDRVEPSVTDVTPEPRSRQGSPGSNLWNQGTPDPATYAAAGVDIAAGERAVELMKASVARAQRPEVVGGIGGFAGLFDAHALTTYRRPLLATSTDGVGTKVAIAQRLNKHDTIGIDLVAMLVDDIVVCGAEPLFLTDYIACGRIVPERIAAIVSGVAEGCRIAGCALIGGETAEHPGLLEPDEYDLAGAATGVVEADQVLGPDRVRPGDVVIAMRSSGLHANGYSLVRHVLRDLPLDRFVPELGRTLGEELLEPTRIYALDCLALSDEVEVHALAHITGGGLAANVARVLPPHLSARIDRSTWSPAPVFRFVGAAGPVAESELARTFNMGVGMVALVPPEVADAADALLASRGVPAWVAGEVVPGDGTVTLTGSFRPT
jgi:phosphoribosylformylglycinamidine cyclo-ligase